MSDPREPDPRRVQAWKTRRARYGTAGHARPYRTSPTPADDLGSRALAFVLRLHAQGDLSEGQCSKALGIDRVTFRALVDDRAPRSHP